MQEPIKIDVLKYLRARFPGITMAEIVLRDTADPQPAFAARYERKETFEFRAGTNQGRNARFVCPVAELPFLVANRTTRSRPAFDRFARKAFRASDRPLPSLIRTLFVAERTVTAVEVGRAWTGGDNDCIRLVYSREFISGTVGVRVYEHIPEGPELVYGYDLRALGRLLRRLLGPSGAEWTDLIEAQTLFAGFIKSYRPEPAGTPLIGKNGLFFLKSIIENAPKFL